MRFGPKDWFDAGTAEAAAECRHQDRVEGGSRRAPLQPRACEKSNHGRIEEGSGELRGEIAIVASLKNPVDTLDIVLYLFHS